MLDNVVNSLTRRRKEENYFFSINMAKDFNDLKNSSDYFIDTIHCINLDLMNKINVVQKILDSETVYVQDKILINVVPKEENLIDEVKSSFEKKDYIFSLHFIL